ncbi:hypothetical protein VNO77_13043 [Canavalia gladiata]|uniref:Uncharacterized protein n=1 Tax=Canavalia gladiata TaxID=3824 RepID=A0AAN9M1G5_CANGL
MGSEEGNEIETLRDSRRWNQKSSLIFISIALVSPSPFEPHKITKGNRMSKNTEIVAMEEPPKQPTPNLFSLFPNFNFNFQLPFLPPKPKPEPQLQEAKQPQEGRNPNVVRFPKSQVVVPPPLEAEPDANHSSTKTSHPFIIWQDSPIPPPSISLIKPGNPISYLLWLGHPTPINDLVKKNWKGKECLCGYTEKDWGYERKRDLDDVMKFERKVPSKVYMNGTTFKVYVLGGIIISKWIWARWNERKARGKSPNDDDRAEGRPSDDGHRSSDNE